jgi:hypothetical protein
MIREYQVFSPSYDMAPPPPPPVSVLDRRHTGRLKKRDNFHIIRRRESLVLYESFNTLWLDVSPCLAGGQGWRKHLYWVGSCKGMLYRLGCQYLRTTFRSYVITQIQQTRQVNAPVHPCYLNWLYRNG